MLPDHLCVLLPDSKALIAILQEHDITPHFCALGLCLALRPALRTGTDRCWVRAADLRLATLCNCAVWQPVLLLPNETFCARLKRAGRG